MSLKSHFIPLNLVNWLLYTLNISTFALFRLIYRIDRVYLYILAAGLMHISKHSSLADHVKAFLPQLTNLPSAEEQVTMTTPALNASCRNFQYKHLLKLTNLNRLYHLRCNLFMLRELVSGHNVSILAQTWLLFSSECFFMFSSVRFTFTP